MGLNVFTHRIDGGDILVKENILAVQAIDKGLTYYMKDGSTVFDYECLADVLERHPEFVRTARAWLVRRSAVAGFRISKRCHDLTLYGSEMRVPCSRRQWREVKRELGIRANPGRPLTPADVAHMRSFIK